VIDLVEQPEEGFAKTEQQAHRRTRRYQHDSARAQPIAIALIAFAAIALAEERVQGCPERIWG